MSTIFDAYCAEPCEEYGPKLRRGAGGTGLIEPTEWAAWLIEHEHHDLRLIHEFHSEAHLTKAAP